MPSRDLKDLHPTLVKAWLDAHALWLQTYPELPNPFITCTHRSSEEQNELYAQGRTKKGKVVTRARGGQSPHNFNPSYAFDIAFINDGVLDWRPFLFSQFVALIERVSNEVLWGGRFVSIPDRPHFELKGWKQLE